MSVHHADEAVLESLLEHLKAQGMKRHSILMPDRASGEGFTFFIYEEIDSDWVRAWQASRATA